MQVHVFFSEKFHIPQRGETRALHQKKEKKATGAMGGESHESEIGLEKTWARGRYWLNSFKSVSPEPGGRVQPKPKKKPLDRRTDGGDRVRREERVAA